MLIYMIVWKRFRSRASRHFLISISISDSRREGNYEGFVGIITGLTSNLTILGLREIHNLIYNKKLCNQL